MKKIGVFEKPFPPIFERLGMAIFWFCANVNAERLVGSAQTALRLHLDDVIRNVV
jgi:hypothetical protein